MTISEALDAPSWVRSAKALPSGLDLLGLRLPVQTIGGSLLDGITTVTPAIRYVALRAWMIQQYRSHALPDNADTFTRYAAEVECAVVLGSLLQDRSIPRLIGADEALVRLDGDGKKLEISPLVISPAATIYTGPSEQLGISGFYDDSTVPVLTKARGLDLASAVGASTTRLSGIKALLAGKTPSTMTRDDLGEIGASLRIDQIPGPERLHLVQAILPVDPMPHEIPRISSYCALMLMAKTHGRVPTESDVFHAACSSAGFGEFALDSLADGWLTYCVRDLVAVTQEAVLEQAIAALRSDPNGGRTGANAGRLVSGLLERISEHDAILRDLELLETRESVADLRASTLFERIEKRTQKGLQESNGVKRWEGDLIESNLYSLAYGAGAGALSLSVVAWMFAAIRLGSGVREALPALQLASYQGSNRLGLEQVVVPEVDRWLHDDLTVLEVAGGLAYRTVQQHLHIAWARMRLDFQNDVALLTTETDVWFAREKSFSAGRTASRLPQAVGWLRQLQLVDDGGLTPDGDEVLRRGLVTVAGGTTP